MRLYITNILCQLEGITYKNIGKKMSCIVPIRMPSENLSDRVIMQRHE